MRLVERLPPLPEREPETHKGTYGRNLLLVGSEGMAGAAILAARAAYRAGAGLATVAIDRVLFSTVSPVAPEAVFLDTAAWPSHLSLDALNGYQAVLMGPGIGTSAATRELVWWILKHRQGPVVLDADALNIIASEPDQLPPPREDRVWTPHPGEFARLAGRRPAGDEERLAAGERFVKSRGGVLVLKGHHTLVMDAARYAVNATGNPGMATAGSGDVLSGMLTAFLGQGIEPFAAARAAVHLHGRAGDLAAEKVGQISLVAGDLIDWLPQAILEHPREKGRWKKD